MRSRDVIVFDIETVPAADAARRLLGQWDLDDAAARDALADYFLEKTDGRNDFPRQPFHQVVAIAYAFLQFEKGEEGYELVLRRIAAGGAPKDDERSLLQGFFHLIERRAPLLISFNGRGFDVPVLKYRAMAHGLRCPRWFSEGDKWSNYDARYDRQHHLDLLEILSDHGASARCSLHEVATSFGIPGKLDVAGDDVRAMFEQGEIEAIRRYCETDVCTTLLVYLRWLHFSGALSTPAWQRTVTGLRNWLQGKAEEDASHFRYFLDAWEKMEAEAATA